ncbi:hypothetical protein BGP_5582 [Beggiatoa sp. PS]|nr:hypothetical protein BGP_5582 [Beggiatoa sp. PS]
MSMVQVQAQLSFDDLLKAVEQFNSYELEQLIFRVLAMQIQRQVSLASHHEYKLLLKIGQQIPKDIQTRYDELIAKRLAETLTTHEYQELLTLTEQIEQFEAKRVKTLAELAQLRQISLGQLMNELNIQPPTYA